MSTTANRCEYLVLSRGEWDANLTAGDIQRATGRFYAWYDRLCAEGKFKPGHQLAGDGKIVRRGKAVMDGPHAETKEVAGGY